MSPAVGGISGWRRLAIVLALAVMAGPAGQVWAAAPRVLPDGAVPQDRRLEQPKDYDGYFPFEPPQTAAAWAERAEQVKRQILVATGLWPMPAPTPANAVVHGRSIGAITRSRRSIWKVSPAIS